MARRGYPPEFRRRVVDLVDRGRKVSEVAAELEVMRSNTHGATKGFLGQGKA